MGMTKLVTECHLVDACLSKHGIKNFTTYQRGSQVLDYILVNPLLLSAVQGTGYEPFNLRILSNHRGIFLDVYTPHIFGSTINPLTPIQLRDLSTRRSHQIAPYFEHKHQHLQTHNWFNKLHQLQHHMTTNQANHALAEDLYNQLVAASQYAGSHLKKFPPAPYSPTIARLRNIKRLLLLTITQLKTSRDMSDNIRRTKAKLGNANYSLPESLQECQIELNKCT